MKYSEFKRRVEMLGVDVVDEGNFISVVDEGTPKWIANIDKNNEFRLDTICSNFIKLPTSSEEIAEEKERRWWAKHGRKVNEYRVGDVIMECDGYFGLITELPREFPNQKRSDDESDENNYYVKLDPDWEPCDYQTRHVEDLKLVCLAENRLDVKVNE